MLLIEQNFKLRVDAMQIIFHSLFYNKNKQFNKFKKITSFLLDQSKHSEKPTLCNFQAEETFKSENWHSTNREAAVKELDKMRFKNVIQKFKNFNFEITKMFFLIRLNRKIFHAILN